MHNYFPFACAVGTGSCRLESSPLSCHEHLCSPFPSGAHSHLQDPRSFHECGEGHQIWAAGSAVSQQHRWAACIYFLTERVLCLLCPWQSVVSCLSLSPSPRCWDPQCLHGGRNVRYPSTPENRHREGFPGGREQSHQILREIQRYPPLHDLQLIPGKVPPVPPKLPVEQKSKGSHSCFVLGS